MHRGRWALIVVSVLALAVLGVAPSWAEGGRLKVGEVRAYAAETPHPYPKTWTDRVSSPVAEWIRIHFTGLSLGAGDTLTVSSPDRSQVWMYTARGFTPTATSGPSPSTVTRRSSR
jgi:hypothetical protein